MLPLNDIFAAAAGVLIVLVVLSQASLWQRKEYRLDRLLAAYRQGELRTAYSWLILLSAVLFWLSWLTFLWRPEVFSAGFVWAAIIFFALFHLERINRRGVLRPEFTLRATLVVGLSYLLIFGYLFIYYVPGITLSLQLLTLIYFAPLFVGLASLVATAPALLRKRQIIVRAKRHRQALTNLTTIGITGSYGKTTTKVFLEHILRTSGQNTRATQEHRNAVFPVAEDILGQLTSEVSFYVAELGAYRRGEIKELAELTRPQVGLITAIGSQHQALFGSAENIARAKWELIDALPADGIAVLNADDSASVAQAKTYRGKVIWYSETKKADVWLSNPRIELKRVTAAFHFDDFSQEVAMPLVGRSKLSNTLAAAAAAYAIGLKPTAIVAALTKLPTDTKALQLRELPNGRVILDDSYSANEAGVLSALEHLELTSADVKVVVLEPLIELGAATEDVHRRIGQALGTVATKVITTRAQSAAALKVGLGDQDDLLTVTENPDEALAVVAKIPATATVVILGRVPQVVREAIYQA